MKQLTILLLAALLLFLCACAVPNTPTLDPATPAPLRSAEPTTAPEPLAPTSAEPDLLTYDDLPEEGIPYANANGYASMELVLPRDWSGRLIASEENGSFGIDFWRSDSPENVLQLRYRPEQIGLCGTGLISEEVTYAQGLVATRMQYEDLSHWTLWVFQDTPGVYTLETDAANNWVNTHIDEIDGIIGSFLLGEGVIRQSEAEANARTALSEEYAYCNTSFDCLSGLFTVHFWDMGAYEEGETVMVDAAGGIVA